MSPVVKAFIAGGVGTLVAGIVEPKLMSMFPSVPASGWQGKAVHAAVGGASAAAVWYLLPKVG